VTKEEEGKKRKIRSRGRRRRIRDEGGGQ